MRPPEDRNHRAGFEDEAGGKKKIPYGMNGAVLHSKVPPGGEAVPQNGGDPPSGEPVTGTPHAAGYAPPTPPP